MLRQKLSMKNKAPILRKSRKTKNVICWPPEIKSLYSPSVKNKPSDWLGLNDDSWERRLNKNKNEFEPVSAYAMIT